jgi:hypothetical protein
VAKTARDEMVDELESFEADLGAVADEDFEEEAKKLEDQDQDDLDTDESGKEEVAVEGPTKEEAKPEEKSSDEETKPETTTHEESKDDVIEQFVTLPDDVEAFREFAGKKITYAELQEAKLVDKLVTWGHQGRHLVQRNQEELEETKKMRALLEEQLGIVKEDRQRASEGPALTPEQSADALVNHYAGEFDTLAKSGAIEDSFFETYPKVAAQIEHRFRATRDLAEAVIKTVTELKTAQDQRVDVDTTTASRDHLKDVMVGVSETGDLFNQLGTETERKDFMQWATRDDSTLNWVDKQSDAVTPADISASWLLYLHEHPDKFKTTEKAAEKKKAERKLAGGGGTGNDTASKSVEELDEFQRFEKDLKESYTGQEY